MPDPVPRPRTEAAFFAWEASQTGRHERAEVVRSTRETGTCDAPQGIGVYPRGTTEGFASRNGIPAA